MPTVNREPRFSQTRFSKILRLTAVLKKKKKQVKIWRKNFFAVNRGEKNFAKKFFWVEGLDG